MEVDGHNLGNLFDKKEVKRLKKIGLTDREIRNLRSQQTSGGKLKNPIERSVVEVSVESKSEVNSN